MTTSHPADRDPRFVAGGADVPPFAPDARAALPTDPTYAPFAPDAHDAPPTDPAYAATASYPAPGGDAFPAPDAAAAQAVARRDRRRRRLRATLVAVPAVILVAGAASVVTLVVAGHDHDTSTQAAGTSAASAGGSTTRASASRGTVGVITAVDGGSWTLRTADGTRTVEVSSSTHYGTPAHPQQESMFQKGTRVRVLGSTSGDTIDATHVVAGKSRTASGGTSGTTGATTSTTGTGTAA